MRKKNSLQTFRGIAALLFLCVSSFGLAADSPHTQELETLHAEAERLVSVNRFREALRVYETIILAEPDDETAYANMGRIYLLTGQRERAKDAFLNALDINPENETALLGLEKI
ncbi:MAG: tetratricopeptide repeat protein [Candidatus Omnitrophica bacterium]|nr:tetratricopeptide repeat protein [Candidatus Omnitrophota bacterium]